MYTTTSAQILHGYLYCPKYHLCVICQWKRMLCGVTYVLLTKVQASKTFLFRDLCAGEMCQAPLITNCNGTKDKNHSPWCSLGAIVPFEIRYGPAALGLRPNRVFHKGIPTPRSQALCYWGRVRPSRSPSSGQTFCVSVENMRVQNVSTDGTWHTPEGEAHRFWD